MQKTPVPTSPSIPKTVAVHEHPLPSAIVLYRRKNNLTKVTQNNRLVKCGNVRSKPLREAPPRALKTAEAMKSTRKTRLQSILDNPFIYRKNPADRPSPPHTALYYRPSTPHERRDRRKREETGGISRTERPPHHTKTLPESWRTVR